MRQAWPEQQATMAALRADPGSPVARRKARMGGFVLIGLGLVSGAVVGIGFWPAGRV